MDLKIISGGQTGVDQMALRIASEFGIPTGGTAPRNYMTEDGRTTNCETCTDWLNIRVATTRPERKPM